VRISINAAGGRAWCSGLDGSRWYITRVSLMGLACWTPTGERSWAHEVGVVGMVLVKGDTSLHVLICPRGEKAGVETSICTAEIASIYVFMINTLGLTIWHPLMRMARSLWRRHQSMVAALVDGKYNPHRPDGTDPSIRHDCVVHPQIHCSM